MLKINKNLIGQGIVYSLGMLVTFVLSVFTTIIVFTPEARAEGGTNYIFATDTIGSGSNYYGNTGSYYNYYSNANNVCNPVPAVYSINPSFATSAINGNLEINLTGGNFTSNSLVQFNNTYRSTRFVDANHIYAILTSADFDALGANKITVFNPMPCGGTSNAILFNVNDAKTNSALAYKANSQTTKTAIKKAPITTTATTTDTTDNNSLTANALFGLGLNSCNGFLPGSLIGWLILAILILLAVILIRKLYGEKEYHQTPLKHQ